MEGGLFQSQPLLCQYLLPNSETIRKGGEICQLIIQKSSLFVKQNELLKPDLGQFVNRQQSILDALSSSLKKVLQLLLI